MDTNEDRSQQGRRSTRPGNTTGGWTRDRCELCESGHQSSRSDRPGRREHLLDDGTTQRCTR